MIINSISSANILRLYARLSSHFTRFIPSSYMLPICIPSGICKRVGRQGQNMCFHGLRKEINVEERTFIQIIAVGGREGSYCQLSQQVVAVSSHKSWDNSP